VKETYYEKNREEILRKMNKKYTKKPKGNIQEERGCKNCNSKFEWCSSSPNQIYCSTKSQKESHKNKIEKMKQGIMVTGDGKYHNFYRLRFEIFKRDNFTCQYCGRNVREDKVKLHCDHIIPRNKGGLFVDNNLITSCEECNLGKRDILLSERKLVILEGNLKK